MENITIIVTLFVCAVLVLSYVIFREKAKKQRKEIAINKVLICDFYKQEMSRIKKLELAGIGNDGNSDFEFKQAVKEIKMSNNTRVRLYD